MSRPSKHQCPIPEGNMVDTGSNSLLLFHPLTNVLANYQTYYVGLPTAGQVKQVAGR